MRNYGEKIATSIIVTAVMFGLIVFYDSYFYDGKYNREIGYIDDLSEISSVYKKFGDFRSDLIDMGFLEINENTYERAYNKFLCEKVVIEGEEVSFYISDSCLNVYENEVKVDFDNDGRIMIYYVESNGEFAYLRFAGEEGGLQTYNLETGEFEIQGKIENEYEIVKYNNSYDRFIKQINALVF